MSDAATGGAERNPPDDLLSAHPETAYFWGRVAGDGDLTSERIRVRAAEESVARRLAAIAGDDGRVAGERTVERPYAHDASLTRVEDEYTVEVFGGAADRAAAAFGLPIDGTDGGYRLDALADNDRQLLRGLLEAAGTVCFRESKGKVGVSFVHDDRALLEWVREALAANGFESDDLSETSSGGYWFGVDDDDTAAFGEWVYEGSDDTGLYADERRTKLLRSIERAAQVSASTAEGE
ncbi:MAG: cobalamin biosynthesis protein [Haloglomus sp.]